MFTLKSNVMKFSLLIILSVICFNNSDSSALDDIIYSLAPQFARLIGLPKVNPEIVEEALLEATELIKKLGYPAENHTLITPDGYVLINHRIPYGKNGPQKESGIPVLLVHGMNCESTQWFDNGPESLAYVLADAGYDVWLSNSRGTSFSSHLNLTHDDNHFWDFDLSDLVENDMAPLIDLVLNKTGYSRLLYIGQSMGTGIAHSLFALKPEYMQKIAGYVALAPAIYLKYSAYLFQPLAKFMDQFKLLADVSNRHSWLRVSPLVRKLQLIFCPSENPTICELSMGYMVGYNPYLRNRTRLPIFCNHCSSGSSIKLLYQMAQLLKGDELTLYDYGKEENLKRYKSETAPIIDGRNITVPTVLIYGANDVLATPLNVEIMKRILLNVVDTYLLSDPMAMHLDYMFAKHGKSFLYDRILGYLKKLW